jgi:hypothetical protein
MMQQFRWIVLHNVIWCLVLGVGLSNSRSQAQSATVTGSVLDSKNLNPVPGALVILRGTLHGTITGPDGHFEFGAVNLGEYTLTVLAEGYADLHQPVKVEGDLQLEVFLISAVHGLPDKHILVSLDDGLPTRMQMGVLPRRFDVLLPEFTVRELPIAARSMYVDGVRLIDSGMPLAVTADIEETEVIPGPYDLSLGADALTHFRTNDQPATGANVIYDSRTQWVLSGATVRHDWSRGHGAISWIYEGASDYTDGAGVLQRAGARDGGIAARVMSNIAPGHVLNGGIGWGRYVGLIKDEFDRREVMLRYRFTRDTTILRAVTVTGSLQELEGSSDHAQQSISASTRLSLLPNLRLYIGADYYRLNSVVESGLFIRALHGISPILIDGQFRFDHYNGDWGANASATWEVSSSWQVFTGFGRAVWQWAGGTIMQVDGGVNWKGFDKSLQFVTFKRKISDQRSHGATAVVRASWSRVALSATAMVLKDGTGWSDWGRGRASLAGLGNLFTLGAEAYGSPARPSDHGWMSADVWMESMAVRGVFLRVGIHNLFDSAHAYPLSDFAEPGLSLQIGLFYQGE